jgi:ADP-ribose pyrophosphatase
MSEDKFTEKTLSSQTIYQGRIIHLHVDEVELPDGKASKREIVTHPGAVAVVPLDADGNVLLVRQYRHAAQRVLLEIPAGTLKANENPDDCVRRELQEETGYKPSKLEKLGGIFVAPGYTTEYIHLYLATGLIESRLDMDEDEFIEVERVSLDQAVELIRSGEIADGKSVSALLMVKDRLHR